MSVREPREAEAESVASTGGGTQRDWAGGQREVRPRGPGLRLDLGQLTALPEQLWLDGLEAAEDGVMSGPGLSGGPGEQRTQVARVTRPRPLQSEVAGVLGLSGECLYPGQRQRAAGTRGLQLGQRGHWRGRGHGGTREAASGAEA